MRAEAVDVCIHIAGCQVINVPIQAPLMIEASSESSRRDTTVEGCDRAWYSCRFALPNIWYAIFDSLND